MKATNGANGHSRRIEFLRERQKSIEAALALELNKAAKVERRITARLDTLLGSAVRKTGEADPSFRALIAKAALSTITDEKTRKFLSERGWL